MRLLRLFLCLFLLVLPAVPGWAQGAFDLTPGRWQGPLKGVGIVTLEISDPRDKNIKFTLNLLTADARTAIATGSYRVTANKGQPHFTFHVDNVTTVGNLQTDALKGYDFGGWSLRPGADARAVITYESGKILLDVFDSDSGEHTVQFRLQQVQ